MYDNTLQHYGVIGMKWGVHRARRKQSANPRLARKALNYDKKAAALSKKSEKKHAEIDLGRSNKAAMKATKYAKKSAAIKKKALNSTNDVSKSLLEKRAAKLEYKSARKQIDADRLSKTQGYGKKALKYAIKSDKAAALAAKARLKMASNDAYTSMMKRKISSLSKEELNTKYQFVNDFMK